MTDKKLSRNQLWGAIEHLTVAENYYWQYKRELENVRDLCNIAYRKNHITEIAHTVILSIVDSELERYK